MGIMGQITLVFSVCLFGECIAQLLPIAFPASVISMAILFVLLTTGVVKTHHIKEKANFLVENMAFFIVPSGVGILRYINVLWENLVPILVICFVTTPIVYAVTAWTVQLLMRAMGEGKNG